MGSLDSLHDPAKWVKEAGVVDENGFSCDRCSTRYSRQELKNEPATIGALFSFDSDIGWEVIEMYCTGCIDVATKEMHKEHDHWSISDFTLYLSKGNAEPIVKHQSIPAHSF